MPLDAAETTAYGRLTALFVRRHRIEAARGILGWDQRVMMPDGAARARGETLATLSVLAHELITQPWVPEALAAAEAETRATGEAWAIADVSRMRHAYAHAAAAPAALVEAAELAASEAEAIWRRARAADDFAMLQPALGRVLELQREIGAAKGAALGLSAYDALVDYWEPGARAERIDTLFDDIAAFLPGLVDRALARQAAAPTPPEPRGPFPISAQRALAETLLRALGFDFARGRLDVSLHPFCGGAEDDVRITTRYREDDFGRALMGVLHECGHALYEQGLPKAYAGRPVGAAAGLVLHESQSLSIEMQIGRSDAFLRFAASHIAAAFGASADDPAYAPAALAARGRRVARSLIRVDADELTYPAHVILRTRLERALIADELALEDLPEAWSEGMDALVGVRPPSDRDGCLQDIHWPDGAWGYFPTYTLGAMAAAQIVGAIRRAIPDLDARIARGDFEGLLGWLRREIHGRAASGDTDAILTAATGAPLGAADYRRHLEARYG